MATQLAEAVRVTPEREGRIFPDVSFEEDGYRIKQIEDKEEIEAAYRLRHDIFCGELKWVLRSVHETESDEYDDSAVFFGVFDADRRLLAFVRLILPDRQFMMEKVFLPLVDHGHRIRKEADTAEVSRLCVAPEARNIQGGGNFGVHQISLLLFKAVYQWCKTSGIRYLYAVTELKVYRLYCQKGFPYRMIGNATKMPDGATVAAVMMDWEEFELQNALKRPALLKWFKRARSSSLPGQSQQHGPGLRHSVFA